MKCSNFCAIILNNKFEKWRYVIMDYNKRTVTLFGLVKALQVEFFGFFVMLFFWAVAKAFGLFSNILFGIAGLSCVVCIMADYGLKQGEIARKKVKFRGEKMDHNYGAVIGLVAMIPTIITLVLLFLSKLGVIGNFLPAYKILNASYFPFFDLFAHTADINKMSWTAFIPAVVFPLLYVFPTWLCFRITFDSVDVKEKVMYK